jgi:hypothetical protein
LRKKNTRPQTADTIDDDQRGVLGERGSAGRLTRERSRIKSEPRERNNGVTFCSGRVDLIDGVDRPQRMPVADEAVCGSGRDTVACDHSMRGVVVNDQHRIADGIVILAMKKRYFRQRDDAQQGRS